VRDPPPLCGTHQDVWTEPDPEERERALGYAPGTTAAPGVTASQRHIVTGRCMDATALESLLALSIALRCRLGELHQDLAASAASASTTFAALLVLADPLQFPAVGARTASSRPVAAHLDQMLRVGWQPGRGLGAGSQGTATPLVAQPLGKQAGLGFPSTTSTTAASTRSKSVQTDICTAGLSRYRRRQGRTPAGLMQQDRQQRATAYLTARASVLMSAAVEAAEPEHANLAAGDI
jgi:hypothetical protein